MQDKFFITSTGTEIGKTMVTATLVYQLRQAGKPVTALKPLISGIPNSGDLVSDMHGTDTAAIMDALDQNITPEAIDNISPIRFKAPLAPSMAAKLEGRELDYDDLISTCKNALKTDGTTLIEGVGGSFVPLMDTRLVTDWIKDLNLSSILVAGSYLGTISHTIATIEAMHNRGLDITSIIISESAGKDHPDLGETALEIKRHTNLKVITLPRISGGTPWRNAPGILRALSKD
jgi:dethiobiotin synthetase